MSMYDREFDPYQDYDEEAYDDDEPLLITCKECKKENLVWSEIRIGVFRLYDRKLGRLHKCDPSEDFK